MAVSAISLFEITGLVLPGREKIKMRAEEIFRIAKEMSAVGGALRDPADRAIVATARVHSLRLLTSDRRIIDSNLVPVVE